MIKTAAAHFFSFKKREELRLQIDVIVAKQSPDILR